MPTESSLNLDNLPKLHTRTHQHTHTHTPSFHFRVEEGEEEEADEEVGIEDKEGGEEEDDFVERVTSLCL